MSRWDPDLKSLSRQLLGKDKFDIRLMRFHFMVTSHVDVAAILKSKVQNTLRKGMGCAFGE
jgi:hypothetical protein